MSHGVFLSGARAASYPGVSPPPSPTPAYRVPVHTSSGSQDVFETRRPPPPGISVNRVWHPTCTVGDILPGDIGFYYKKKGCDVKQRLIRLGERFINVTQSGHRGDASVLHAYIVLQSYPLLNRLLVADAAGGPNHAMGVEALFLDFTGRDKDPFDVDSFHLYYRFDDARLRARVVRRAQAWTVHKVANFSMGHATSSPMRVKHLLPLGRRRIRHLLTHSPFAGPVPNIGARPGRLDSYKVMCSEFVASVYIPEIIGLFCEDRNVGDPAAGLRMGGLKDGIGGEVFDCDPRYLVPSSLQGRLARSPDVTCVGCVPPAYLTE